MLVEPPVPAYELTVAAAEVAAGAGASDEDDGAGASALELAAGASEVAAAATADVLDAAGRTLQTEPSARRSRLCSFSAASRRILSACEACERARWMLCCEPDERATADWGAVCERERGVSGRSSETRGSKAHREKGHETDAGQAEGFDDGQHHVGRKREEQGR